LTPPKSRPESCRSPQSTKSGPNICTLNIARYLVFARGRCDDNTSHFQP
jgi:hypothetical protein